LERFAESDNLRINGPLEAEEIGDRTPSEFFRHLRNLAASDISETMVLTLWKRRLPETTQRALAGVMGEDVATLTRVADNLHELRLTSGQFTTEYPKRIAAATRITAQRPTNDKIARVTHNTTS
jgi:hypothetical protein